MTEPKFLKVEPVDNVLVREDEIAKVLLFVNGARNEIPQHLFLVSYVDSGEIKFIHG